MVVRGVVFVVRGEWRVGGLVVVLGVVFVVRGEWWVGGVGW